MSRLLALFLLITLPLSWTATAIAAYCKHETVTSEQNHIGHHADRDHRDYASSSIPDPENQDGMNKPHAHCSLSHVCYCAFPMGKADISTFAIPTRLSWLPDSLPLPSSLPDEPERPKWSITA